MAIENSVKLLWQCAQSLGSDTHTERLLKSYYINTSRKIARNVSQLPEEQYGISKICSRCGSDWNESEFKLRLKPQLVANNTRARKLIAKLDEAESKPNQGILTQSQRKRAKWLRKRVVSRMEICCDFCQHKTTVPLEKPKKRQKRLEPEEEATPTPPIVELPQMKKKKKKKTKPKDLNAGLKISKPAIHQPPATVSAPKPSQLPKQTQNQTKISSQHLKATKVAIAKGATTPKPPSAADSSKTKKKKQTKKPHAAIAPKMKSKTQQQNALLQLASLLKTQTSKTATNTPQSRLESLLK